MINDIKQNIDTEIEILREISNNLRRLDYAGASERKLLITSVESLKSSLRLINNSIPKLLEEVSGATKLPQQPKQTSFEKVEFKKLNAIIHVTIEAKDRETFLKELSISENLIKKLKKRQLIPGEKYDELRAPRGYVRISNRIFLPQAQTLISKGYFKNLALSLRKANIDTLFSTYVAITLFTTLVAFVISIMAMLFFLFFTISLFSSPIIYIYEGNILLRLLKVVLIPIVVPILTFVVMYIYPSTEKDSLAKKIDRELPFAVIHMSAISGSGIEPTEIFKIIGLSKEYPYLRKEIRKVLNQINLYGYDLVTSLNNVSKTTPSTKLAELFGGLSTSITSGSSLQDFFEKRSETLLVAYKLEREKYTKMAETFMDIYISVVIAAPMILMILLVMVSVLKIDTGFSPNQLTFMMIAMIGLINGVFLAVLQLKQPNY